MGQSLTQFSGGLVGVVGVLPGGSFAMGIRCLGGGWVFLADDVMLQDVGMRGQNLMIQAANVFDSVPTVSNPGGHGVFAGGSNVGYVGGTVSFTRSSWQAAPALGLWERRCRRRYRPGSAACIRDRHVPNDYRCSKVILPSQGRHRVELGTTPAGAYTTSRSNTMDDLGAAIVSGGFGGNAHEPDT